MKYIIIGAVAGGASTAARLRRLDEHAEIVIFEKGAYISYANCGLPYYIGDVIRDRNKLFVQTAAAFHERFNVDVRVNTMVTAIDAKRKVITAHNLLTGAQYEEQYDKLVLSPGAEPVRPKLPGLTLPGIFTLRNVADTDTIKAFAGNTPNGRAVVIGGGFIGLEMAENLKHTGMDVTVVEMGDQLLAPLDKPMAAIIQQHMREHGVNIMLNTSVAGFRLEERQLMVDVKDGRSMAADIVILSIGVRPDTQLAVAAGLETGPAGGIKVNEYLQTSDADIYAVGDAIEFTNPITGVSMNTYLAGPANKQGRICANNIAQGNKEQYKGAINTAILKVFDMTAGSAGMASKHLKRAGIEHLVTVTHSQSHASYYPGGKLLSMQLAFRKEDGRLLGAQVAGLDGVDKRLDVLAGVIQNGGTIYDLQEFEHAYAPPYSSAKDPVNMAGFVAGNMLDGKLVSISREDMGAGDGLVLDVRSEKEHTQSNIPGSVNIPVDDLRSRLNELPLDRDIYIYCQVGQRGYLAQRILVQHGFSKVFNLRGGFYLWDICNKEDALAQQLALA